MAFSEPVHQTDLTQGVCIVTPTAEPYRDAASHLKGSLEGVLDATVDVLPNDIAGEARGRHVVALGNMMDNEFLKTLYFRAYDLTDRAWPGPGGWAIRTVPRSLPDVGHTIVVGVSEAKDAAAAAKALATAIEADGAVLPYQHRVNLGRWSDLYAKPAQERLEKGDAELELEFTSGPGDWTYMWAVSEIGMLAVQTGMEELMRMFCRQICHFARTRWFERHLPDPPQIHGFLRTMLLPFTILENHPGIPIEQREETLEAFLGIYRSTEGAGNPGFLSHVGVDRVRQNHQTMSGVDLYYGGRYFHQVHGLAEGMAWMKLAEVFFAPQMMSNKPVCDSWGHQWAFSLANTADFAMAAGKMDYFSSAPFLEAVDRALIAHSNQEGGPLQYFLMAAAVTGNDEYLKLCRVSDEDELVKRAVRPNVEPLRTWVTGRPASDPVRLGRVGVAPLSRLFYDSIEGSGGFAPEGIYLRDTPFEKAFDKVFLRSGWSDEDDYLLLDGISGGSHSYQDSNCIVRYTSRGKNWFGGRVGFGAASVREHVGMNIAVDGSGPGCESRYASLCYLEEGEGLSVVGTMMAYPQQGDWFRHIVHSREGWFLVVDELRAAHDGDILVEGRWHVIGDVTLTDGRLSSVQDGVRLTMRHAGSAAQDLVPVVHATARGGTQWIQRALEPLRAGEGVRFATLFWTDAAEGDRDFALISEGSGYRVEGGAAPVPVALSEDREGPDVFSDGAMLPTTVHTHDVPDPAPFAIPRGDLKPAWEVSSTGAITSVDAGEARCCIGDDQGNIAVFGSDGEAAWNTRIADPIRAVLMLDDGGAVAGGDGEKVVRFDASGKEVWANQLVWQPMNWDYWTRMNVQVLSLTAGDVNGDGEQEILAGCADRHIYVFDGAGEMIWRSACQWGPPTCLELARLREGSELQILAGMADPCIHGCVRVYDAEGECVDTLSRPDIMSWSIPSWSKCLRVADLDDDGWAEAVSGVDTNHRQLIVYRRDGEILWDADLGGAVLAAEVADGRVYAGAANGFVQCFDAQGGRLWDRFLVSPVVGLAPDSSGGCLVGLRDGTVVALDADGAIRTSSGNGEEMTAAAWASSWPEGGLLVACGSGALAYYGL